MPKTERANLKLFRDLPEAYKRFRYILLGVTGFTEIPYHLHRLLFQYAMLLHFMTMLIKSNIYNIFAIENEWSSNIGSFPKAPTKPKFKI